MFQFLLVDNLDPTTLLHMELTLKARLRNQRKIIECNKEIVFFVLESNIRDNRNKISRV